MKTIQGLLFLFFLSFTGSILAQSPQMPTLEDSEGVPVTVVKLPLPEKGETTVAKAFEIKSEGEHRIAFTDMGRTNRPVAIAAVGEEGENFSIALHYSNWADDKAEQTLQSKKGKIEKGYKVAKNFGMKIKMDTPGPIYVSVIGGETIVNGKGKLFVDAKTMKKGKNKKSKSVEKSASNDGNDSKEETVSNESSSRKGKSNMLLYGIIGVMGLVIAFLLGRRNSASIIILLMSTNCVFAQVNAVEIVFSKTDEAARVNDLNSRHRSNIGSSFGSAMSGATTAFNIGINLLNEYQRQGGKWENMFERQKDYNIELDQRNQPSLPSSCYERIGTREEQKETQTECRCLDEAYERLNRIRTNYEITRIIGQDTKEYVENAIAFGDSMSSLPGVGLGWPPERIKILNSFKEFKSTYKTRLTEFDEELYASLMEVHECEKAFGFEDWYGQYGFMYYDFLTTHYNPL